MSQVVDDDPMIAKIHAHAEVFHPKVEFVFAYLQVFSACCVMFAHGAGEVGYMAGPLGTIVDIVNTGQLNKNVAPITWVRAILMTTMTWSNVHFVAPDERTVKPRSWVVISWFTSR